MRRRDIARMWSQIVHEIGKDKYTSTEWQESYENFWRCMLSKSEPYIRIENLGKITDKGSMTCDKDEQCLDQSDLKSPSSDSLNESEPLAVWQRKLKALPKPDECPNTRKPNNVEIKKLLNDESPKCSKDTKLNRKRLSIDTISFSKEHIEKTNSKDEQKETKDEMPKTSKIQKRKKECESKWRIERQSTQQILDNQTVDTNQQNTKRRSNATRKNPDLEKEEKIILKMSKVQSSQNQENRVATRQQSNQDQQCPKSKLKRAKRKSQSKQGNVISANTEDAHKSPSAINLTIDTAIASSASTSNSNPTDDAENLSVQRFSKSEEQNLGVINDSHDELDQTNDNYEKLIKTDKLVDIFSEQNFELDDILINEAILSSPLADEKNISELLDNNAELTNVVDDNETVTECVEEIDNYLQSFTEKTPSEIDQEIAKSTEFFNNFSTSTTDVKTPLELDAIMQDALNYDDDDADIISVATSWDGDDENTFDFLPKQKVKNIPTTRSEEPEKEPQNKPEVKSHLSELRSFRIPKKSTKNVVSPAVQMPAGNVQAKDQNQPREKKLEQSQKYKQPQQENQPAKMVKYIEEHSVGQPAPVFAPPYRVPAKSTEVPSIAPTTFGNNDYKATVFGIKCWQFLDGRCGKNNCNHMLNSIGMVLRRLNQMNKLQLCSTYKFVLRHGMLFKTYFVEFADVFGSRFMHKHLFKMIQDCGLYISLSASFLNDLFHVLLRYQISPETAAGHFMKHLWKPNNAVVCSELTRQLLRILSKADWYNYMENLEQLFYCEKFPIPGDFLTSIAHDAVTKNQPMLITKAWELVLFNPIDGNANTLSSVIEILKSSGLPQLQPIQDQEQHHLLQQQQPVQLHQQQQQLHFLLPQHNPVQQQHNPMQQQHIPLQQRPRQQQLKLQQQRK